MDIKNKAIIGVILVIIVAWLGNIAYQGQRSSPVSVEPIKIGAILPMTGPAAIWGEQLKNGMELAKSKLLREGVKIKIIYEDSQANPTVAISAYRKLTSIDGVDVIFSAFSRVSIPLISLSKKDQIPLIMTIMAAENAPSKSKFAYRLYPTASQYVHPYFKSVIKNSSYGSIAILYINDDYGVSVRNAIIKDAKNNGVTVTSEEGFLPNSSDFRTQLLKIKKQNPKGLIFVGAVPLEITGALKQFKDLKMNMNFFDASLVLSLPALRKSLGEVANGVYTLELPFSSYKGGEKFINDYTEKYKSKPIFAASLGYDMVNFVDKVTGGRKVTGQQFIKMADKLKAIETITGGEIKINKDGEINPIPQAVKIVNGKLVKL